MRHLYSSRVEVFEPTLNVVDGQAIASWAKVVAVFDPYLGQAGEMMCRLDLNFVRPGKDAPPPWRVGVAPDRAGLMFCDVTSSLKAGQMIRTISGPVSGNFLIKTIPDLALDYDAAHHIEVQIFEVNQSGASFPGKPPE